MAGHVFILRSDLTKLLCDAWLMPTDPFLDVNPHWIKDVAGKRLDWKPIATPKWSNGEARVMEIPNWPAGQPKPWLVNTGATSLEDGKWYADGVAEFFQKVAPGFKKLRPYATGRPKPLIALPLVGTGRGGGAERRGAILNVLLPALYAAAKKYDIDVALVTKDGPAYAAAVHFRNSYPEA